MSPRSSAVAVGRAAPETWTWPVDTVCYDRHPDLSPAERDALTQLGMNVRRCRGHDRDSPQWDAIERLLRPLDDARVAMWRPDSRHHQRAIADAIALILMRCAEEGKTFWGWSDQDWVRLIGTGQKEFEQPWPGWIDGTIRPYLTAYAYLLTGFTNFQLLGHADKQRLAWRVFGKDLVERVVDQLAGVLNTWGYRVANPSDDRLSSVVCLVLLLNPSPRLEDLTTAAFDQLRTHPAVARCHGGTLHAFQRATAALGHCDPPSLAKHGSMPAIEGTHQQWVNWIERWYATSTLTPKVRGTFRGAMAKAGRWLAAEHPEITEPGQWTRQTCAAWVAAVDRLSVGDYVQRTVGLSKRSGKPLSPRTKAVYLTATRTVRNCSGRVSTSNPTISRRSPRPIDPAIRSSSFALSL
ncbi:hypothetical protein ABIA39_009044 [Nocardia sp. GAS34]|uniref:hypothetical protein n=1 Tax=unclassified Nocardia TaxID=2637762 RepID=UPI003D26036D